MGPWSQHRHRAQHGAQQSCVGPALTCASFVPGPRLKLLTAGVFITRNEQTPQPRGWGLSPCPEGQPPARHSRHDSTQRSSCVTLSEHKTQRRERDSGGCWVTWDLLTALGIGKHLAGGERDSRAAGGAWRALVLCVPPTAAVPSADRKEARKRKERPSGSRASAGVC